MVVVVVCRAKGNTDGFGGSMQGNTDGFGGSIQGDTDGYGGSMQGDTDGYSGFLSRQRISLIDIQIIDVSEGQQGGSALLTHNILNL